MTASNEFLNELQRAMALGSPVLVLGPGCHRIGFDDPDSASWGLVFRRTAAVWRALEFLDLDEIGEADQSATKDGETLEDERTRRREFLERFWLSKLSEETVIAHRTAQRGGNETRFPLSQDITKPQDELPDSENSRTRLASLILCGLVDATRALGAAIDGRGLPVIDWQRLTNDGDPADDSDPGMALNRRAALWLRGAHDLAMTIREAAYETEDEEYAEIWSLMKIDKIGHALEAISMRDPAGLLAVSGARVEWLSDLLWHVLVSGAGVPPAQDELDFFVNLGEGGDESERSFSRPHPGEYRGADDGGRALRGDLRLLVPTYEVGRRGEKIAWTSPRERLTLVLAASLLESWRRRPTTQWISVALLSDYDLLFERALLELTDPKRGEALHVLIPVAIDLDTNRDNAPLEWIIGTRKKEQTTDGRDIAQTKEDRELPWQWRWRWFRNAGPLTNEPLGGPVVVRLSGAPLYEQGSVEDFGLADDRERLYPPDATVTPVALMSEHDSVRGIKTLTQRIVDARQQELTEVLVGDDTAQPKWGLSDSFFGPEGLSWDRRSWLFFGHHFSDWLPRLQLLFTVNMLPQVALSARRSSVERLRLAVDRHFDWPERALLDALQVHRLSLDLGEIIEYARPHLNLADLNEKQAERVEQYRKQVRETVRKMTNVQEVR